MIVGEQGPAVVISAETAYWLERICRVSSLRQRLRDGQHQAVSQELLDLRRVAMTFDPALLPQTAAVGSDSAEAATGLEQQEWFTVSEAADRLGMGERGVRLACSEDRLDAEQVAGRWRISREALENFNAARAA
ncbi:helix-turn-helix domain-containing protein [Nocardioides bruguierae]|uniref:Helix-turn-helix domain-containing protein n=1 Tax=Nocardioides bruguierae TaxID=2945102 RepID=A0A9X2D3P8_9ACTN|nr:helix-turn-helix domain-containing protein [Nocardioides bruguierae]MCM0618748.1 helix-turn-helix domain-containing protein [Nocardioides bruguierae]